MVVVDPQIEWFRDRILRGVVIRLVVAGVLVASAVGLFTFMGQWADLWWSVALGCGTAILACGAWVGISLLTNPVDVRYMRSYLAQGVQVCNPAARAGFDRSAPASGSRIQHLFTVIDESADDRPLYDVFSLGHIVMSGWRSSETAVFYSQLVDGRTVCTDRQLSVPRPGWVLNLVRSKDPEQRLRSHSELLDQLAALGVTANPSPDPWLVLDHLSDEREGYRQLGPFLSCFLDVDGDRSPWRLTVSVPPAELLGLEGVGPTATVASARRLRVVPPMVPGHGCDRA